MHILLTRPLEDCSEMILKFKSLGHKVSHIPLINIEKVNYEKIKFSDYLNKDKAKDKKSKEKQKAVEPLAFDMAKAKDRTKRLTIHSSSLSDAILTKDGSKLFYLSSFEKGFDLWVQNFKKNETKLLAKLGTSYGYLKFDEEEANIIVITNKAIQKMSWSYLSCSGKLSNSLNLPRIIAKR